MSLPLFRSPRLDTLRTALAAWLDLAHGHLVRAQVCLHVQVYQRRAHLAERLVLLALCVHQDATLDAVEPTRRLLRPDPLPLPAPLSRPLHPVTAMPTAGRDDDAPTAPTLAVVPAPASASAPVLAPQPQSAPSRPLPQRTHPRHIGEPGVRPFALALGREPRPERIAGHALLTALARAREAYACGESGWRGDLADALADAVLCLPEEVDEALYEQFVPGEVEQPAWLRQAVRRFTTGTPQALQAPQAPSAADYVRGDSADNDGDDDDEDHGTLVPA